MNIIEKYETNPAAAITLTDLIYLAQDGADAVATAEQIKDFIVDQISTFTTFTATNPTDLTDVSDVYTDVLMVINDGVTRTSDMGFYLQSDWNNAPEGMLVRFELRTNADIAAFNILDPTETVLTKSHLASAPAGANYFWVYQVRNGELAFLSLTM